MECGWLSLAHRFGVFRSCFPRLISNFLFILKRRAGWKMPLQTLYVFRDMYMFVYRISTWAGIPGDRAVVTCAYLQSQCD